MQGEETAAHPYELRAQPSKALLQRLYRDVGALAMEEIELAKLEMHQRGAIAVAALRGLAFSAAFGTVALAAMTTCVIAALAYVIPLWLAALVAGVIDLAIALALGVLARQRLALLTEPLRSTIGALVGPPRANATPDELRSRIELTRRRLDETLSALERKTDLVAPMRDTALGLGSLGVALAAIVRSDKESR